MVLLHEVAAETKQILFQDLPLFLSPDFSGQAKCLYPIKGYFQSLSFFLQKVM
jgi:hypothetical protein